MSEGFGRLALTFHLGKVEAVYRETDVHGARWMVDCRLTTGATIKKAMVVGARLALDPKVAELTGRKSWGLVGFIAGNSGDPFFLPIPWASASDAEIRTHDLLDEHHHFTNHIENFRGDATDEAPDGTDDGFGVWTLRSPGNAPPDEDDGAAHRYIQVVSKRAHSGGTGKVELMGGARRIARGGEAGDGGRGDAVAIDQLSSPHFAAWMAWVSNAITGLATLSGAGGGPIPPAGGAPIAPWNYKPFLPFADGIGGDGGPPPDDIPASDGEEATTGGNAVRVVGVIMTASKIVTGA